MILALTTAMITLLLVMAAVLSIAAIAISRRTKDLANVGTELRIAASNLADSMKNVVEALREMGKSDANR